MNPNTMIHNVEESELVYAAPHDSLHIENLKFCYKVNLLAPEERHHAAVLVNAETERSSASETINMMPMFLTRQ